jgi:hypothetical protein
LQKKDGDIVRKEDCERTDTFPITVTVSAGDASWFTELQLSGDFSTVPLGEEHVAACASVCFQVTRDLLAHGACKLLKMGPGEGTTKPGWWKDRA